MNPQNAPNTEFPRSWKVLQKSLKMAYFEKVLENDEKATKSPGISCFVSTHIMVKVPLECVKMHLKCQNFPQTRSACHAFQTTCVSALLITEYVLYFVPIFIQKESWKILKIVLEKSIKYVDFSGNPDCDFVTLVHSFPL